MGFERHWGGGCMFSYFLLPSLSLSPDSESTSLLPTGLWSKITHPQQGNRQERKEGEGIGRGMREETVSVFGHLNQFRIHSITSYCDSHFGVFGRCKGCESETAGGNGQHFAVGCFSQSVKPHHPSTVWQTCRQTVQKAPGVPLSNCLFFSFCDCNKKHFAKGHPEFCVLLFYGYHYCCYFVVPVDVFFWFLSADDYLNAKKQHDENRKKKEKTWIFGI